MEDILLSFNQLIEKLESLDTNSIENKEIAEIEWDIKEIEKISKAAKEVNEAARRFEADGEFDIDELNQFYRNYLDFQDLLYSASISLAQRREVERQALSTKLSQLRESKYDSNILKNEIANKIEERKEAQARLNEITEELDFCTRLADNIQSALDNQFRNLDAAGIKSLEAKIMENRGNIKRLNDELEFLKAKDQSLSEEIEKLQEALEENEKKVSSLNSDITDYRDRQAKFNAEKREKEQAEVKEDTKEDNNIFSSDVGDYSSDRTTSEPSDDNNSSSASTSDNAEDDDYVYEDIPVIELPEDNPEETIVNVTVNIKGPENKETAVVLPVIKGKTLFENPSNKNIFDNTCREKFGPQGVYNYKENDVTVGGQQFDLQTPIQEDMTIHFNVKRQFKVTFVDENSVVQEVYINDGEYLNPNMVELVSNKVNYANPNATQKGEQKNLNQGWKLEKAMTGLRYWGVRGEDGKTDKFKFDKPITRDVVLEAKKGIKGKSVAAGLSGIAVGAALDVANPMAGRAASIAAGAVDRIAKYKLAHHKDLIGYDKIAEMTRIRKASAKVMNHFRKNQTIKNLQYFCRGVILGAAGAELSKFVGNQVDRLIPDHQIDTTEHVITKGGGNTDPVPTPDEKYALKGGDQFEYGFKDSYNAVGNTNSVGLNTSITNNSSATSFYDTVNRQWLPVNEETIAQVASEPGNYAVRYMTSGGDAMWESAIDAIEKVGGMTR